MSLLGILLRDLLLIGSTDPLKGVDSDRNLLASDLRGINIDNLHICLRAPLISKIAIILSFCSDRNYSEFATSPSISMSSLTA